MSSKGSGRADCAGTALPELDDRALSRRARREGTLGRLMRFGPARALGDVVLTKEVTE